MIIIARSDFIAKRNSVFITKRWKVLSQNAAGFLLQYS